MYYRTRYKPLVVMNRSFQDEVEFEVVSREAGQSYCSPGGGYEDIAECRKTRTEQHPVPAIVLGTIGQQNKKHVHTINGSF